MLSKFTAAHLFSNGNAGYSVPPFIYGNGTEASNETSEIFLLPQNCLGNAIQSV